MVLILVVHFTNNNFWGKEGKQLCHSKDDGAPRDNNVIMLIYVNMLINYL